MPPWAYFTVARPLSTSRPPLLTELKRMELLLLSRLGWRMRSVTAHDFLPALFKALPLYEEQWPAVVAHAEWFADVALPAYETIAVPVSVMSAGALLASLEVMGAEAPPGAPYAFVLSDATGLPLGSMLGARDWLLDQFRATQYAGKPEKALREGSPVAVNEADHLFAPITPDT
jgi:hypothetical protein